MPKDESILDKKFLTKIVKAKRIIKSLSTQEYVIWQGDTSSFLKGLKSEELFDLVVTSPPYNIGKAYEKKIPLENYLAWQESVIDEIVPRIKNTGSLCWQVGNYIENGCVVPLDIEFAPLFKKHGLKLRNRIVWHFGHGLHSKDRFSGRYEVVLWYSKSDDYTFNLDEVRIPPKYPSKKHYKGPNKGKYSSNPRGKNPEDFWDFEYDVWDVPNVKSNHIEKTGHPCQFPVGLIERLILPLTKEGDLVFDPFAGVGSAGVAAALHKRYFWGADIMEDYVTIAAKRIQDALNGQAKYRPYDKPLYDHTKSPLSKPIDRS